MTAPTQTPDTTSPAPGTGWHGQTFLVGENVYLRSVMKEDAKYTASFRPTLFPIAPSLTEKWIEEELPKERGSLLLIVRKADDVVVGSAQTLAGDSISRTLRLHVDPLYGERGQHWKAEALTMLIPWLVEEQHRPCVVIALPADEEIVAQAARDAGMRQTARFRERYIRDGKRVDQLIFQRYNSLWLKAHGDPDDVEIPRTGTGEARPVPAKVPPAGDPPKNAMMVGQRVYLRPYTKADSEEMAEWPRYETETFFEIGRHLMSQGQHQHWVESSEESEFADWIHFFVCLRENDKVIGTVGLLGLDYIARTGETASFFHQDYRASGYGSEAKQLLLEYAFDRLGLHMVESFVFFPNTRSAAAVRKQGYREAGRINWVYTHNGTLDNGVVFDLLASEWRAMPRSE